MNKTAYPIFTEKYIVCIPTNYEDLNVPFALKANKIFNYRILVNLEYQQLEEKLDNVLLHISALDFYNFLYNCKNLIEFEKTLTLNFDGITYSVNLTDFSTSLSRTISYVYSKFFYQINKGINL